MQHADFYAVVATLAPVFIAAGLYALAPKIKSLPGNHVGVAATLLVVAGSIAFFGSLSVLGELGMSDTSGLRWALAFLTGVQFAVAAMGFLSQAIGHEAASNPNYTPAGDPVGD